MNNLLSLQDSLSISFDSCNVFVTSVLRQNRKGYHFLLIITFLLLHLILFMLIYGDLTLFLIMKDLNTFCPLLMMLLDVLGFIF